MAFADSIRTKAATMEGVASLIESVLTPSGPAAFTSWTPTLSVTSPMTFTSTAIVNAKFLQVGKIVFFIAQFSGTVGGTSRFAIRTTLPVTAVNVGISAAVQITDGGVIVSGSTVIASTTTIDIRRYDAAQFTAGVVGPTVYGFYEAA